jgi:hypothetical protein
VLFRSNTWVINEEGGAGFAISTKTVLEFLPKEMIELTAPVSGEKGEGD